MFKQKFVADRTECPETWQLAIDEYMAYADVCNGCYVRWDEDIILEYIDNEDDDKINDSWRAILFDMNAAGVKEFIMLIWW